MALKGEPFKKIFGVLKATAPTLLTAFGGPAGAVVAGIARSALGTADDVSDDALAESIAAATGSAEGLAMLRQIEADLKKFELDNGLSFAKLTVEREEQDNRDRADARARQAKLNDKTPQHVLYITSLGFYGSLAMVFIYGVPDNGKEVLLLMIGSLGAAWGAAVQYFVGSSSGSKTKTELLSK